MTGAGLFRRGERHDKLSSTTIRLSPNPRNTEGARRHENYAYGVPYDPGKSNAVSPASELGPMWYRGPAGLTAAQSWDDFGNLNRDLAENSSRQKELDPTMDIWNEGRCR